jgi:hypothetical protein
VIPIFGASPFFTNSQRPVRVSFDTHQDNGRSLTRQLITSQTKGVPHDLFVQVSLNLEHNLTDSQPSGPVVKAALSLSHSAFVAACVDTYVCRDALVEAEFHASQALLDGLFGNAELCCGNAAVVVAHAQAVVAPNDSGAAHTASCGHTTSAFPRLASLAGFGDEPAEAVRRR